MHISLLLSLCYGGVLASASAASGASGNGRSLQAASSNNGTSQSAIDELNGKLSSFGGRVRATNNTNWMRECAEYFKRGGFGSDSLQVKYSTYHLKNKPSGLCNHQLYVDLNAWTDEIQDAVLGETDLLTANFGDIEDKLPPLALPGFMSFPESAKDVSEIVKFANDNNLKVSVKNSGHSYTGGSSSMGSVQINLRKYNGTLFAGFGIDRQKVFLFEIHK